MKRFKNAGSSTSGSHNTWPETSVRNNSAPSMALDMWPRDALTRDAGIVCFHLPSASDSTRFDMRI